MGACGLFIRPQAAKINVTKQIKAIFLMGCKILQGEEFVKEILIILDWK